MIAVPNLCLSYCVYMMLSCYINTNPLLIMETGRRLKVKWSVMPHRHGLSTSSRFITSHTYFANAEFFSQPTHEQSLVQEILERQQCNSDLREPLYHISSFCLGCKSVLNQRAWLILGLDSSPRSWLQNQIVSTMEEILALDGINVHLILKSTAIFGLSNGRESPW